MDKIIISIEGNIGVGKSTFVDIIKNNITNSTIVHEPVDLWKKLVDTNGENILHKFYGNIDRWAYSFQNLACITRMIKIEEAIKSSSNKYIFLDRSLGTDKNVFEKMLYDSGKISEIEHQMYLMWCDFYHQHIRPEFNNIIIYLRSNPFIAHLRINKRGRDEEKDITIEYLENLHKYHEKWLINNKKDNIIIIDCDRDFEFDNNYQNEIIQYVQNKINEIISQV